MIFYKSSHLEKPCDTERITQLSISPFQGFVDVGLFFFRWTLPIVNVSNPFRALIFVNNPERVQYLIMGQSPMIKEDSRS
jgi:hypothetical protein